MDIKNLKDLKNINLGKSNLTVIKWLGSLVILGVGIAVAFYFTYSIRITEQTYYTVNMPEYLYTLKDGKKLKLRVGIGFSDYEVAKNASKKARDITNLLFKFFGNIEQRQFSDMVEIAKIKMMIMIELNSIKQPVDYVSFLTKPMIM